MLIGAIASAHRSFKVDEGVEVVGPPEEAEAAEAEEVVALSHIFKKEIISEIFHQL